MHAPRILAALALPAVVLSSAPLARLDAQSPIDLRAALATARSAGPLRQIVDARRQVALGQVGEQTQWANPSLEWRRENLGSPLQPDIFATLYVPWDLSGRRLALRQVASAGKARIAGDATTDVRDAELQVARAWLRAAVASGSLEIATQQYDALREIARVDAERLREGLVSEAVGLRTSLEADRARVALVTARNEAAMAQADLARLLGLAEGAPVSLATLTAPTLPLSPDTAVAVAGAVARRPDVQAREAGVREAQRRLAAEQRGAFGEVQLQGGTKETGGFMTGQVGLAMPMPFFNRNSGARQRAAGQLAEARIQRDDLRRVIRAGVVNALAHYQDVRAAASDAATFGVRGREVARIARLSYREGHATLTELLDAERAAADAMHQHLRWAADAWLARLELERTLGARLDAESPLDLPVLAQTPSGE
ncbi:TolC family protein [Gemmatimonas sp.]|jgi:cobalt-zinc-cadmium efflux system outer membrane protein|uniref:TolC family protein n=1 Tax=Gemmatimonas sp. TaxID=1962908 RepID=UPI0037BFEC8D